MPDSAGAELWRAGLDWGMMQRCFPDDTHIAQAVEVYGEQVREGPWVRLPGLFHDDPDGGWSFEQTLRSDGRVLLQIRGERVSEQTVP